MLEYILKRFGQSFLVLFVMSILVFVGVNLVGDPVEMLINPEADQAEVERVIRELGLDKPVSEQYWYFLTNALKGDLGSSFIYNEPALKLILQRMPATLELALFSLFISLIIAIPLGILFMFTFFQKSSDFPTPARGTPDVSPPAATRRRPLESKPLLWHH